MLGRNTTEKNCGEDKHGGRVNFRSAASKVALRVDSKILVIYILIYFYKIKQKCVVLE
jgi:hypothetical protein